MDGSRTEHNALTLDYCRYQIENGPWSERTYVLEAHRRICRHYGLPENAHQEAQPWLAHQNMKRLGDKAIVRIKHEFESDFAPEGKEKVFFVTEIPHRFAISVNGGRIAYEDVGSWIDHSFKKIDVTGLVRQGPNEIVLEASPYAQDIEIEACYLAGDFRVVPRDGRFVLAAEEPVLPLGDWSQKGYPFYSGNFRYYGTMSLSALDEGERVLVRVEDWEGTAVRVTVNGKEAGTIGWEPYELDVTPLVRKGDNEIAVEVIGSLRNLLGPHHLVEPTPGFIHPGSFYAPNNWKDEYDFVRSGLMGSVKVVRLTA